MNNLQKIKNAVYKAIPSKKELKFGCYVIDNYGKAVLTKEYQKWGNEDNGLYRSVYQNKNGNYTITHIKEIIGTPITLFDCSKIIKDKHTLIDIWKDEELDNQSEECINFISNLLK